MMPLRALWQQIGELADPFAMKRVMRSPSDHHRTFRPQHGLALMVGLKLHPSAYRPLQTKEALILQSISGVLFDASQTASVIASPS
jgi:hypothetical protein